MSIKKKMIIGCLMIGMGLPFIASAATLTIHNGTDEPSTSQMYKMCSSSLPGGVTEPGTTNVIGDLTIRAACIGHSSDCLATVYMTRDCAGSNKPAVAEIHFNTSTGIMEDKIKIFDNTYHLTLQNSFEITFTHDHHPPVKA